MYTQQEKPPKAPSTSKALHIVGVFFSSQEEMLSYSGSRNNDLLGTDQMYSNIPLTQGWAFPWGLVITIGLLRPKNKVDFRAPTTGSLP